MAILMFLERVLATNIRAKAPIQARSYADAKEPLRAGSAPGVNRRLGIDDRLEAFYRHMGGSYLGM
jgi:hypothetical protein